MPPRPPPPPLNAVQEGSQDKFREANNYKKLAVLGKLEQEKTSTVRFGKGLPAVLIFLSREACWLRLTKHEQTVYTANEAQAGAAAATLLVRPEP